MQLAFTYKQNNHVAFVDKSAITEAETAFHPMMDFITECKCSFAILHAPTIFCEIVEQMWTSARCNTYSKTLTVVINGNEYAVTGEVVRDALKLPVNSTDRLPNYSEIVRMLRDMHYNGDV